MPRRPVRLTALATAVAALAAGLVAAIPATAATGPRPTAEARSAGIDRAGHAWLGWSAGRPAERSATSDGAGTAEHSSSTAPAAASGTVDGIDVSSWQGNVDWASWWAQGKRFAYVKATEGTSYTNPYFAQQYNGSYDIGMTRGAYHFALPSNSSGSAQATWFADHGGGWSADGKTLPGVLDIEYNPYGATCYGLSQSAMVSWINSFLTTYRSRTGRDAVIYTTTSWWTQCTGNSSAFASTHPLWIARYTTTPGTLPAGWSYYTFWQYTDSPIDQDVFNGDMSRLTALAMG